jgi:uncharacterized protein
MDVAGVDQDGFIKREGALALVSQTFMPIVEASRTVIPETFGPDRLHSAYLYGSIPRGTAIPGVSDLDLLLALNGEPTGADRSDADLLETALGGRFAQIIGVGIGLASTATLLSELERYDLGWFVACLCTPLLGADLASRLPRYRPTTLLSRETNGDLGEVLPRWRDRLNEAGGDVDLEALSRAVARRLVRTGLTLVMPRWGGWTSDLDESAAVFGHFYPARSEQMQMAAAVARTRTADLAVLRVLIDDLGPWLASEYLAVHGRKAVRGYEVQ